MLHARRPLVLLFTIAAVVLAGCTTPGTLQPEAGDGVRHARAADLPEDWVHRSVPSGEGHDHSDQSQHVNLSTPNFEVLGYDPLTTDYYGTTATGMGCGGVGNTTDARRIAVVHTIATDVAFIVADVTDPANPQYLGEYLLPNAVVWDATVTPDGLHAIVGAYPPIFGDPTPVVPPVPGTGFDPADVVEREGGKFVKVQPKWRDACTGETRAAGPERYLPLGPGIVMVGLQDPTNPTFEDWASQPVIGPHSVYATEIDGTTFVAASVTNLVHQGSYYTFFEVTDLPTGAGKLQPLSVIRVPGTTTDLNGHVDVSMAKHPKTGQLLAYLANWDGVYVYDLSIPQAPVEVASWMDGDAGNLHTTFPVSDLWEDRVILIAGQEVGEPVYLPSGWIYILDVTDPANPQEIGRWTLPVKPDWDGGLQFSPHYVDVVNRTLFVSNYHGGLWAVDVTEPETPRTAGLFVPDRVPPTPYRENPQNPSVGDVIAAPDGTLTAWDNGGGVYTLRFDASDPAPRVEEWPTDALE